MKSLSHKIVFFLFILWGGLAVVSAVGYSRMKEIQQVSKDLLANIAPSAGAALQVESAIHKAYNSTYVYCSYLDPNAKPGAQRALDEADDALATYRRLSINTSEETHDKLKALVDDVRMHAVGCLKMTDEGMTPQEFESHREELLKVQLRAAMALREAAKIEQEHLIQGAGEINRVVSSGFNTFVGESLVMLLVTFGVAFVLTRSILPPINELTRAANRFSAEDLAVSSPLKK